MRAWMREPIVILQAVMALSYTAGMFRAEHRGWAYLWVPVTLAIIGTIVARSLTKRLCDGQTEPTEKTRGAK